jgi:DNA-directed RNA polymerase specialized sigma24 family protein
MNKDWELNEEQLNSLLNWLDADREAAGSQYALIQLRLIRFFATRGCVDAEHLADRCINITIRKIDELSNYVGDRSLYFLGVAKYVMMEKGREDLRPVPEPEPPSVPDQDLENCLERCLAELPADDHVLVLDYEAGEKQLRIQKRRQIAEDLGMTLNALRIKIFRLHQQLKACIEKCLEDLRTQ